MTKKLFLFFMMLGSFSAFAQDAFEVSGVVKGDDGEGLPGVSVIIKGTTHGVSTDFDGAFTLSGVSAENTLVFSFIGMKPQEFVVGNQTFFEVDLQQDVENLEEVVVIGYGTSKSKDLTAPIANVDNKDLNSMSVSSATEAIQGKVAGVNIVSSGAPGESPQMQIRGIGSLNQSDVLYVVDGMQLFDIAWLNPNDIETMSILKDASASAIYGMRAAGGVVIITTKTGAKNEKMRVSYDGYYGVQKVTQRLEMANSAQYADFIRSSNNSDLIKPIDAAMERYGSVDGNPAISTDWYDELIKSAPIQNHNISIMGGTEKSTYNVSLGYFSQGGIMNEGQGNYERFSLKTNFSHTVSEAFNFGLNMTMTTEDRMTDDDRAFFQAYIGSPMYPAYDYSLPDSEAYPKKFANPHNLGFDTYYTNPLGVAYYHSNNRTQNFRVLPNLYAEFRPFKTDKLTFRSSLSMDYINSRGSNFTPDYQIGNTVQPINSLTKNQYWTYNMVWDNFATYEEAFGNHNLKVMVGSSTIEENTRFLSLTAQGVKDPNYIHTGDESTLTGFDGGERYRMLGLFTRVSYNYDDRYLVTGMIRRDASSKYQEKWGTFPSLGLGWVVSEEEFFKSWNQSTLDHFKLRASYGDLGNAQGVANTGFAAILNGGLGQSGLFGGSLIMPGMIQQGTYSHLSWERTREFNIGFESKLFDYRLNFEADYFNRQTLDMIIMPPLSNGLEPTLQNAGDMKNTGLELALNWSDQIGDFSYSLGGNFTKINNMVTSLGGAPYIQAGTEEFPQMLMPGEAAYSFYGWEVAGVYQNQQEIDDCPIAQANNLKPGDFRYVDRNGDGVIDESDRTILGDPNPDFYYGFNFNVAYKNISLSANFMGSHGGTILNRKRADINKHAGNNIDANLANNLWTGEGSTNAYPSAEGMFNTWNNGRLNSFYLEDASFFRLQNIRLTYNLPSSVMENLKMTGASVYLNVDRPYTWFNTNGFTPEVPGGVDEQTYPIPAVFSLGASLTF
ncbi:TonB-dependent receptor [Persicobacter sp. CCB-QB2]|uniref:SusC/RagA family TonB-linked outer membrane protein n=1 Tax=Persicobacter sp. CCB-QB2 TaxID=1561025 RepID=UPI0006A96C31|nr:TonB-dependent receptor [Persicobacter sp. CCB-QB2]